MNEEQLGFNFAIEIDKTISDKNIQNYINEANKKFSFDFGINIDLKEITNVAEKLKTLNNTDAVIESPKIDTKSIVDSFSEVEGQVQKVTVNMDKLNNTTSKTVSYLMSTGKSLTQVLNADDTVRSQKLVIDEVKKQNEQLQLQKEAKNELIAKEKELANLRVQYANSKGDAESETISLQIQEKSMEYTNRRIQLEQQGLVTKETEIELDNILVQNQEKLARISSQQQDKSDQISAKELARQQEIERSAKLELEYQQKSLEVRLKKLTGGKNADFIEDPAKIAKVTKAIQELDGATKKDIAEKARIIAKEIDAIGTDANAKRIDELGKSVGGMGFSFSDLTKAVSGAMIIREFWSQLKDGISYVKELNSAMTDLSITMSITGSQFDDLVAKSSNLAKANGTSVSSVLEMAKTYANANTTIEEVMAKLEPTVALSNISRMDTASATSAVQSVLNQFKLVEDGTMNTAQATEYLGDVLTSVSQNMAYDFSSGLGELIDGINTAGSVMHSSGVSLEYYSAMLGTLVEATGSNGSEIANATKMFSARILQQGQVLEDAGESAEESVISMKNAEKALKSIGVSIRGETTGELRDLDDILNEVASKWDTLSDSTKAYVGEMSAGNRQRSYFIALMENMSRVQELSNQAMDSNGTLMEANGKYVESIEGKLGTLTATYQQFYATLVNSDAYVVGIEMLTNLISGITTLMDMFGAMPVLLAGVTAGLVAYNTALKLSKDYANGNIVSLDSYISKLTMAKIATIAQTVAVTALNATLTFGASLLVGAVVSAIGKWATGLDDATTKVESARLQVDKLNDSLSSTKTVSVNIEKYEQLKKTLNDQTLSVEQRKDYEQELSDIKMLLIGEEPKYATILNDETKELEKQVELMKYINDMKVKDSAQELANDIMGNTDAGNLKLQIEDNVIAIENAENKKKEIMERAKHDQEEYYNELLALGLSHEESLQKSYSVYDSANVEMEQQDVIIQRLTDDIVNNSLALDERNAQLNSAIENGANTNKTTIELDESTKQYTDTLVSQKTATDDVVESTGDYEDRLESIGKTAKETANSLSKMNSLLNDDESAEQQFVSLGQELENIQSLLEDINKNGLTYENMDKVLSTYEDFKGTITDVADVQEFLNSKFTDMEEAQGIAYSEMYANSSEYFNNNVRDTQEWLNYQAEVHKTMVDFENEMLNTMSDANSEYFKGIADNMKEELKNANTLAQGRLAIQGSLLEEMAKLELKFAEATMYEYDTPEARAINDRIQKIREVMGTFKSMEKDFMSSVKMPTFSGSGSYFSPGGSSSSTSATEKEIENMENLADVYYEVENALTDLDNAIKKNQLLQENATSKDKVKLMQEELDLIKDQAKAYKDLENAQREQLNIMKSVLERNGFTFDSNEDISNYQQRIKELMIALLYGDI